MTITYSQIEARKTAAPWSPGTVEYDMESGAGFPYGKDCSAYVGNQCWGIDKDVNTETLLDFMHEIDPNDLKPGDAVGHCGPGTAGAAGHIQLFDGWGNQDPNDNHYWCWQQNGIGLGPHRDLEDWPSNYKAYRFNDVVDDPTPAPVPVPAPAPIPAPTPAPEPPPVVGWDTVTVEEYEDPPNTKWNSTLSGIAEHENIDLDDLLALNPQITNRDLIHPGDRIRVR